MRQPSDSGRSFPELIARGKVLEQELQRPVLCVAEARLPGQQRYSRELFLAGKPQAVSVSFSFVLLPTSLSWETIVLFNQKRETPKENSRFSLHSTWSMGTPHLGSAGDPMSCDCPSASTPSSTCENPALRLNFLMWKRRFAQTGSGQTRGKV